MIEFEKNGDTDIQATYKRKAWHKPELLSLEIKQTYGGASTCDDGYHWDEKLEDCLPNN